MQRHGCCIHCQKSHIIFLQGVKLNVSNDEMSSNEACWLCMFSQWFKNHTCAHALPALHDSDIHMYGCSFPFATHGLRHDLHSILSGPLCPSTWRSSQTVRPIMSRVVAKVSSYLPSPVAWLQENSQLLLHPPAISFQAFACPTTSLRDMYMPF